eukprot:snap_masked-scaffold_7-processed-gene-19.58-mRNA-1 protein AED:1.00 eAED:1.00 QI:0/0/0/0/1/1/2/0/335
MAEKEEGPKLPLISESEFLDIVKEKFIHTDNKLTRLLSEHSYIVLTNTSEKLQHGYRAAQSAFEESFSRPGTEMYKQTLEQRKRFTGPLYFNEKGYPLWKAGYEKADVRECFHFPTQLLENKQAINWPSITFKSSVLDISLYLKEICDLTLEHYFGFIPGYNSLVRESDEDLSVSHLFRYPNANQYGFSDKNQGDDLICNEHIDKSLFVAEICPSVPGLEVFDLKLKKWIMVEKLLNRESDIILFPGAAAALLSKRLNPIKAQFQGCLHRVRKNENRSRFCLIFEQKFKHYMNEATDPFFTKRECHTWNKKDCFLSSAREENSTQIDYFFLYSGR